MTTGRLTNHARRLVPASHKMNYPAPGWLADSAVTSIAPAKEPRFPTIKSRWMAHSPFVLFSSSADGQSRVRGRRLHPILREVRCYFYQCLCALSACVHVGTLLRFLERCAVIVQCMCALSVCVCVRMCHCGLCLCVLFNVWVRSVMLRACVFYIWCMTLCVLCVFARIIMSIVHF